MNLRRRPPGPKGKPFIGCLLDFRHDRLGFLSKIAREYGDIVYFKLGSQEAFLLNHPDFIKDVLVTNSGNFLKGRGLNRARVFLGNGLLTSEGEFHLRQRRLIQPAFRHTRINTYGEVMVNYTVRMSDRLEEGSTVNIFDGMLGLTLVIAGKTLFDTDLESEASDFSKSLREMMELNQSLSRLPQPEGQGTFRFPKLLYNIMLPGHRQFMEALKKFNGIFYRILEERYDSGKDRGDLFSMLILARDGDADGNGMTELQLRDETMTLLSAGHETTANALTWTWYLLSQHPEVERRLHDELDSVLGGRLPTVEDLDKLTYTRMVFTESMRLYPPVWTITRRAIEDYELNSYVIPTGALVYLSQYVMHRDPRYYTDPFLFDPERWTPERPASRPKFAYFPFGGGARGCIGESFAWMEGILIIATLARRWKMRLQEGHRVELQPLITLRPKQGMRMILEKR